MNLIYVRVLFLEEVQLLQLEQTHVTSTFHEKPAVHFLALEEFRLLITVLICEP